MFDSHTAQGSVLLAVMVVGMMTIGARGGQGEGLPTLDGWHPLRMAMSLDEAKEALDTAGIAYRVRFMMKDGTTHLVLDREDWRGVVYFDFEDRMTQILLSSPPVETARADEAVRLLEQRLGPPSDLSSGAGTRGQSTERRWRSASVELRLTVEPSTEPGRVVVWEQYTPLPTGVGSSDSGGTDVPGEEPLLNAPPL